MLAMRGKEEEKRVRKREERGREREERETSCFTEEFDSGWVLCTA